MARVLDKVSQEIWRDLENEQLCKVYIDDPQVFDADEILDVRAIPTEIEYYIKWSGYSAKYNEWVAEEYVTPDLRRKFSIGSKKKEIKRLKQEKAKARAMRKKFGRITKGSTVPLTSTPFDVLSRLRSAELRTITKPAEDCDTNGTRLPMAKSERKCKIPAWIIPNEDNEESDDATISEISSECDEFELMWTTLNERNEERDILMREAASSKTDTFEENDTSMPTAGSNSVEFKLVNSIELQCEMSKQGNKGSDKPESDGFKVPEQNVSTNVNKGNSKSVSATLPYEHSVETTLSSDQYSSVQSIRLVVSSESEIDSFVKENDSGEYLLGFNELFEPVCAYDSYNV